MRLSKFTSQGESRGMVLTVSGGSHFFFLSFFLPSHQHNEVRYKVWETWHPNPSHQSSLSLSRYQPFIHSHHALFPNFLFLFIIFFPFTSRNPSFPISVSHLSISSSSFPHCCPASARACARRCTACAGPRTNVFPNIVATTETGGREEDTRLHQPPWEPTTLTYKAGEKLAWHNKGTQRLQCGPGVLHFWRTFLHDASPGIPFSRSYALGRYVDSIRKPYRGILTLNFIRALHSTPLDNTISPSVLAS